MADSWVGQPNPCFGCPEMGTEWGNAFGGTSILAANAPLTKFPRGNQGASIWSYMIWLKFIFPDIGVDQTTEAYIGGASSSRVRHSGFRLINGGLVGRISDGTTTVETATLVPSLGWHLWTLHRNGASGIVYEDGIQKATLAVGGVAGGGGGDLFLPLVGMDVASPTVFDNPITVDPGGAYPASLTAELTDFTFPHYPAMVGPIEIATQGASASAMALNVNRRTVHARDNTQWRIFWRQKTRMAGWDTEPRHIIRGISDFITGDQLAAPVVEEGYAVNQNFVEILGSDYETLFGGEAAGFYLHAFESYGQEVAPSPYAFQLGMRSQFGLVESPFFPAGPPPTQVL